MLPFWQCNNMHCRLLIPSLIVELFLCVRVLSVREIQYNVWNKSHPVTAGHIRSDQTTSVFSNRTGRMPASRPPTTAARKFSGWFLRRCPLHRLGSGAPLFFTRRFVARGSLASRPEAEDAPTAFPRVSNLQIGVVVAVHDDSVTPLVVASSFQLLSHESLKRTARWGSRKITAASRHGCPQSIVDDSGKIQTQNQDQSCDNVVN